MNLNITVGYMYQKVDGLLEVTDKSFSKYLVSLANKSDCKVITKEEAVIMGFEELANWATFDDKLVFIDNNILLCCKGNDIKAL